MTDYMDELTLQVLAASKQLDAAVEAVTTAGHTAHNAGNRDVQRLLEDMAFLLGTQQRKLFSEYAVRMLEKLEGIK